MAHIERAEPPKVKIAAPTREEVERAEADHSMRRRSDFAIAGPKSHARSILPRRSPPPKCRGGSKRGAQRVRAKAFVRRAKARELLLVKPDWRNPVRRAPSG